MIEHKELHI